MHLNKSVAALFIVLAATWSLVSAAAVDTINGTVSDSASSAKLAGVTVACGTVTATTDANGVFQLVISATSAFMQIPQNQAARGIAWRADNGMFSWNGYSGQVAIRVQDILGGTIANYSSGRTAASGQFALPRLAKGIYVVTVKAQDRTDVFEILNLQSGVTIASKLILQNASAFGLAKTTATAADHIVTFTKDGYYMKSMTVPAGTSTSITVKLAVMPAGTCASAFDGKTLAGWTGVSPTIWKVNTADAAIQCTGGGRGFIYTQKKFLHYRIIYTVRHICTSSGSDHQPCILFYCENTGIDAAGAFQFQLPKSSTWDYRPNPATPGKTYNNSGNGFVNFRANPPTAISLTNWAQCEVLVDTKAGTAVAAVCQPPGTKATKIVGFYDPAAKAYAAMPFAMQSHNGNLMDEYKDICIEENPTINALITTQR